MSAPAQFTSPEPNSVKVTSLAIPDDEVPPYTIQFRKRHDRMQTSGYYPHQDEIHAMVQSPAFLETWRASQSELRGDDFDEGARTAVFVDEQTVEVGVSDLDDVILDILVDAGLAVYPTMAEGPRSPFSLKERCSMFKQAGVNRSDGIDADGNALYVGLCRSNGNRHPHCTRQDTYDDLD